MKIYDLRFSFRLPELCAAVAIFGLLAPASVFAADPASEPTAAPSAAPSGGAVVEGKKEKEKEEKVVKGILASSGTYGQFAHVKAQTAGSSPGDEGGVISGSVAWSKGDVCRATITNNGEKTYSVYFAVVGTDGRGSKAFSQTASGTVTPKASLTKEVFGCKKDLNLALELRSAKPLK